MQYAMSVPSQAMNSLPLVHVLGTFTPLSHDAPAPRDSDHPVHASKSEADSVDQLYRRWLKWSGVL